MRGNQYTRNHSNSYKYFNQQVFIQPQNSLPQQHISGATGGVYSLYQIHQQHLPQHHQQLQQQQQPNQPGSNPRNYSPSVYNPNLYFPQQKQPCSPYPVAKNNFNMNSNMLSSGSCNKPLVFSTMQKSYSSSSLIKSHSPDNFSQKHKNILQPNSNNQLSNNNPVLQYNRIPHFGSIINPQNSSSAGSNNIYCNSTKNQQTPESNQMLIKSVQIHQNQEICNKDSTFLINNNSQSIIINKAQVQPNQGIIIVDFSPQQGISLTAQHELVKIQVGNNSTQQDTSFKGVSNQKNSKQSEQLQGNGTKEPIHQRDSKSPYLEQQFSQSQYNATNIARSTIKLKENLEPENQITNSQLTNILAEVCEKLANSNNLKNEQNKGEYAKNQAYQANIDNLDITQLTQNSIGFATDNEKNNYSQDFKIFGTPQNDSNWFEFNENFTDSNQKLNFPLEFSDFQQKDGTKNGFMDESDIQDNLRAIKLFGKHQRNAHIIDIKDDEQRPSRFLLFLKEEIDQLKNDKGQKNIQLNNNQVEQPSQTILKEQIPSDNNPQIINYIMKKQQEVKSLNNFDYKNSNQKETPTGFFDGCQQEVPGIDYQAIKAQMRQIINTIDKE